MKRAKKYDTRKLVHRPVAIAAAGSLALFLGFYGLACTKDTRDVREDRGILVSRLVAYMQIGSEEGRALRRDSVREAEALAWVKKELTASGLVRFDRDRRPTKGRRKGYVCQLEISWPAHGNASIRLTAQPTEGLEKIAIYSALSVENVPPLRAEKNLAFAKKEEETDLLRRSLRRVVDDFIYRTRLLDCDTRTLISGLTAKDLMRLQAAVEMSALRRERKAVPALIALLKHSDKQISAAAIGSLVAIDDRRAVAALTRLAKFSDTRRLAQILDAIASLGGSEAESYLEFVAAGHPDPDIRGLAQEAIDRPKTAPR